MQINHDEMLRRLNSAKNLANSLGQTATLPRKSEERPAEKPTPKQSIQAVIGSLARQGVPTTDIADSFSVSRKEVRAAANAAGPVGQAVNKSIERVRELALDRLMIAMELMTPDKFESATLKDLSTVTANMSRVIEKTAPREDTAPIQLVIYAPQPRADREFPVIDI